MFKSPFRENIVFPFVYGADFLGNTCKLTDATSCKIYLGITFTSTPCITNIENHVLKYQKYKLLTQIDIIYDVIAIQKKIVRLLSRNLSLHQYKRYVITT